MAMVGVGQAAGIVAGASVRVHRGADGFIVASEVVGAGRVGRTDPVSHDVLLGLLEAEGSGLRDQAAKSHAREMMTELARLQLDVLRGGATRGNLERLKQLGEQVPVAADTALRVHLASIVQRAAIEIERFRFG